MITIRIRTRNESDLLIFPEKVESVEATKIPGSDGFWNICIEKENGGLLNLTNIPESDKDALMESFEKAGNEK